MPPAAQKAELYGYWMRQAKRKALTYPARLVAKTMVLAGLSALEMMLGKREVARVLEQMAARASKEADAEEARSPAKSRAVH